MDVLKTTKEGATIDLTHEEIGFLEEALFVLDQHPSSTGGNYTQMINRLHGGFEMMGQLNELAANEQKRADDQNAHEVA